MAPQSEGEDDARRRERDSPTGGQSEVAKALRWIRDQPAGDLEEQQPDRELDSTNERPRESPRGEIERPDAPEHEEDRAEDQRSCRNVVRAQALRDRDRTKCLERLNRDRQPVDERD